MANYEILIGDVYSVKCDAVAVPVPKSLKFEGELGGKALDLAGSDLLKEVEGKFIEMTKSILVDSHNHKNSKFFLLCANPKSIDDRKFDELRLKDTVINATQLCIDKGLKSIVFPLLSTGAYKFAKTDAIKWICGALEEFKNEDINITLVIKDYSTYYNGLNNINGEVWGYYARKASETYDKTYRPITNESFYWHSDYSYNEYDENDYISRLDKYREHFGLSINEMCNGIIRPREFNEYRYGRASDYQCESRPVYPTPLKAVLLAYKVQMNPNELEQFFQVIPNFNDYKKEYIKFVDFYFFAIKNQMDFLDAKAFFTETIKK